MADTTTTTPDPSDAAVPAAVPAATTAPQPATRRTVTMPVLPFAIIGGVLVALVFFGGGVATGFAIGDHHPTRVGMIQPFQDGRSGPFGGQPGFGQNGSQPGGQPGERHDVRPGDQNGDPNGGQPGDQNGGPQQTRPTPSPSNG